MQTSLAHRETIEEIAERFVFPDRSHHHRIQVAAYFRAERRGFTPGHALDDWLAAERELEEGISPAAFE